ncbi:hypothetical protein MRX96_011129 [Rhipicephalus microplus]
MSVPFAATVTVDARPVVVVNSPRRCRMISSLIDDDTPRKKNQQRFAGSAAATAIPTLVTDYSSSCRSLPGTTKGPLARLRRQYQSRPCQRRPMRGNVNFGGGAGGIHHRAAVGNRKDDEARFLPGRFMYSS